MTQRNAEEMDAINKRHVSSSLYECVNCVRVWQLDWMASVCWFDRRQLWCWIKIVKL